MTIKLQGGASDNHLISLNNMKKIADSIQKISYNYEYQINKTRNNEIFIKANQEGSFEIILDLVKDIFGNPIVQGVASAYLYDLIKKMKSYVVSDQFEKNVKELIDEVYKIAIELAEAEYYDVKFKKKEQVIKDNTKKINAELSNYNSMKQIISILSDDKDSLKPTSISFSSSNINEVETIEIDLKTKEVFENNNKQIKMENITIIGVPDGLSRSSKSFYMEVAFIGKVKIRATDKQLSKISDYFKENKKIKIEIEPIVKIDELIETRDARLIKIMESKNVN